MLASTDRKETKREVLMSPRFWSRSHFWILQLSSKWYFENVITWNIVSSFSQSSSRTPLTVSIISRASSPFVFLSCSSQHSVSTRAWSLFSHLSSILWFRFKCFRSSISSLFYQVLKRKTLNDTVIHHPLRTRIFPTFCRWSGQSFHLVLLFIEAGFGVRPASTHNVYLRNIRCLVGGLNPCNRLNPFFKLLPSKNTFLFIADQLRKLQASCLRNLTNNLLFSPSATCFLAPFPF